MEEEESVSQGDGEAGETDAEEKNVDVKKRRKRGKASGRVTFRRKYSWQASSSASDQSEAVNTDNEPQHCDKPVHETHLCSESDGFTESTTALDSASETSDEAHTVVKKRRRRKRFLSRRKSHSSKGVGDVQISTREENELSSSSDDAEISDVDLSDLDVATLDKILESCAAGNNATTSNEQPVTNQIQDSASLQTEDSAFAELDNLKAAVQSLQNNLRLMLSDCWLVQLIGAHVLRILKISPEKNANVDASIFYDGAAKTVGIFVHGVPVSPENRVFKCKNIPDSRNVGSVSDYLTELATRIEIMKVCDGITEHEDFWNMTRGYLDYSKPGSPHYRSGSCGLLIKSNTTQCQNCKEEYRLIERRVKRQESSNSSDTTADIHLSKEKLREKKNRYKKMYGKEKKKNRRLEKRLDKMKIQLDAALSDDFSSLLTANQHKMTPLQKLFWEQQRKAFSLEDSRGMRWHPMLIRLALHLHSLSDNAYTFWGDTKLLMLPSKRRLYDYSHFIEPREGCQPEFLQYITGKMKDCGPEEHFTYVNLMFDEMHIRSGLVVKRSTGELVGYTELNFCEEELRKMQADIDSKIYKPQLAKKVLVYLVNGITSRNVKDVVAVYSSDVLSASHLFDRTWEVIYNLEEAGIQVLTITCDGASVNRKFFFMHEPLDKEKKITYCTKNLAGGLRPLFFILDPPHLLKTIRNALGNSFAHKKTRKLWKNNEYLSWKVIEQLYKATEGHKYRSHKLTKAHIKLTSFSCMTVLYAAQVFSSSVANTIEELANQNKMPNFETFELVKFIRLMNRFFDCMNGKEEIRRNENEESEAGQENQQSNSDKSAYTQLDDSRFDFLQTELLGYFDEWKDDIQKRPGMFSAVERNQMIISHQGLGALEVTVNSVVGAIRFMLAAGAPSVSARSFNQDPLEQYFGKVRRSQGDNNNPTLKNVHDIRLNLHAQGLMASASHSGNTTAEKRKFTEVDSTPLPSRSKTKKN